MLKNITSRSLVVPTFTPREIYSYNHEEIIKILKPLETSLTQETIQEVFDKLIIVNRDLVPKTIYFSPDPKDTIILDSLPRPRAFGLFYLFMVANNLKIPNQPKTLEDMQVFFNHLWDLSKEPKIFKLDKETEIYFKEFFDSTENTICATDGRIYDLWTFRHKLFQSLPYYVAVRLGSFFNNVDEAEKYRLNFLRRLNKTYYTCDAETNPIHMKINKVPTPEQFDDLLSFFDLNSAPLNSISAKLILDIHLEFLTKEQLEILINALKYNNSKSRFKDPVLNIYARSGLVIVKASDKLMAILKLPTDKDNVNIAPEKVTDNFKISTLELDLDLLTIEILNNLDSSQTKVGTLHLFSSYWKSFFPRITNLLTIKHATTITLKEMDSTKFDDFNYESSLKQELFLKLVKDKKLILDFSGNLSKYTNSGFSSGQIYELDALNNFLKHSANIIIKGKLSIHKKITPEQFTLLLEILKSKQCQIDILELIGLDLSVIDKGFEETKFDRLREVLNPESKVKTLNLIECDFDMDWLLQLKGTSIKTLILTNTVRSAVAARIRKSGISFGIKVIIPKFKK